MFKNLKVKLFADGADLQAIRSLSHNPLVKGFTTNPSLARRAGITDYRAFVNEAVDLTEPWGRPISFEVLADDPGEMEGQARWLGDHGKHVFVKIPVTTMAGESTMPLVTRLCDQGIQVNVTAVMTEEQILAAARAFPAASRGYLSVFAGRIADTGRDPEPFIARAINALEDKPGVEVIWASPREPYNIIQADRVGCHVITVFPELIRKLSLFGRDLGEFSLDTVKMFFEDARQAGYTL